MVEIRDIRSTDLFAGTEQRPLQLLSATLVNRGSGMIRERQPVAVRAEGPGVSTPEPVVVSDVEPGESRPVTIPVSITSDYGEGTARRVTVIAEGARRAVRVTGEITVAVPGWTMFLVPHFHYDPVWWNTQAGYAATWNDLPPGAQQRRDPEQHIAMDLVRAHLDLARRDADYKFVLAELDYLKPYWDTHPEDRDDLVRLLAAGRIELVGGMANEPNTNLTDLETTIRNVVYGVGYQHGVIGGNPRAGWMLDVFGHDPSYPAVMADAGMTATSWARGPFHQWGPRLTVGETTRMQFPSEFEWIAPDGRGLLTSYMAHHYSAGWQLHHPPTLADAETEAYALFQDLKKVAATRNVLLPVGADHVIPSRWATEIHRDWNDRYVWPRFVVGLPTEFFDSVRSEAQGRRSRFRPQSRDMNPVYTGKDVSYIDTKQAHRAAETTLLDAEKLATLMSLLGADYPAEAIDKSWRQLVFNAHHDAVTGTESDQVYLDLLGGWREAYELATEAGDRALARLADRIDTRGEGRALIVVNPLSWQRTDLATVTARFPAPGPRGIEVRDPAGTVLPAVLEAEARHPDGTLAELRLSFVASEVPATGYRTYRLVETAHPETGSWQRIDGTQAQNAVFLIEADPDRGGALSRIVDKRSSKDLVQAGEVAAEFGCYDEYPEHPDFSEGPWHLMPTGHRRASSAVAGTVRAEVSPAGQRLVTSCRLGGAELTQEITLWNGLERVDFHTRVDGWRERDRLLRVRFPLAIGGARPVYEVGNAVIGRSFGFPDVDAAVDPWTLDNPAHTWVGLSATARVALGASRAVRASRALGVAEVIADDTVPVRELVVALAQQGVTATTSRPDGPRYGALDVDSNLPDVRLSIGGPEQNPFTARVLDAAGEGYASWLSERIAVAGQARLWIPPARPPAATWVPSADLRGDRDLPVLVVAGRDAAATAAAVADLAADLADATIEVDQPGSLDDPDEPPLERYSAALLHRGTPGAVVEPNGTLHLSLMRACSGWPSGIWIDPPQRTAPDGSSFAWQHWSHSFDYALTCGAGDWRAAGFVHSGHSYNHPLRSWLADPHEGDLPASAPLLEVEPAHVVVTALKPHGNPSASGHAARDGGGITLRCYETRGQATQAEIRCFVPLHHAAVANVLEQAHTDLAPRDDGSLLLDLPPAGTTTATAEPALPVASGDAPHPAKAQPVFARYWLHNTGPAPFGHHRASVQVQPSSLHLTGTESLRVTVSATADSAGTLELISSPGLHVIAPEDLHYSLGAGEYEHFDIVVGARDDAAPGVHHLCARVSDDQGSPVEDVAVLRVGSGEPGPELDVQLETDGLALAPTETAEIRVRLRNLCNDEVRGEAQLLSPFGTWHLITPWQRAFAARPGQDITLTYEVAVPAGTPALATWALVKVMAFGHIHYTPTIPLTIKAPADQS